MTYEHQTNEIEQRVHRLSVAYTSLAHIDKDLTAAGLDAGQAAYMRSTIAEAIRRHDAAAAQIKSANIGRAA